MRKCSENMPVLLPSMPIHHDAGKYVKCFILHLEMWQSKSVFSCPKFHSLLRTWEKIDPVFAFFLVR